MSAPIRSSPDNLIGTALRVLYGMRYSDTCPFAVRIALETRRSPERLLAASGRWNEAQLIRLGEHPRIGSPPLETLLQGNAFPRTAAGQVTCSGYDPDQGRGPLFALVSDDLAAFWDPTSADPHTRPDRPLIRPTPVLLEGDQRIAIRQASF